MLTVSSTGSAMSTRGPTTFLEVRGQLDPDLAVVKFAHNPLPTVSHGAMEYKARYIAQTTTNLSSAECPENMDPSSAMPLPTALH